MRCGQRVMQCHAPADATSHCPAHTSQPTQHPAAPPTHRLTDVVLDSPATRSLLSLFCHSLSPRPPPCRPPHASAAEPTSAHLALHLDDLPAPHRPLPQDPLHRPLPPLSPPPPPLFDARWQSPSSHHLPLLLPLLLLLLTLSLPHRSSSLRVRGHVCPVDVGPWDGIPVQVEREVVGGSLLHCRASANLAALSRLRRCVRRVGGAG